MFNFVCWVEYRREMRCPQEGIFEAARDETYFLPEAALFGKKKEKKNEQNVEE